MSSSLSCLIAHSPGGDSKRNFFTKAPMSFMFCELVVWGGSWLDFRDYAAGQENALGRQLSGSVCQELCRSLQQTNVWGNER